MLFVNNFVNITVDSYVNVVRDSRLMEMSESNMSCESFESSEPK